MELEPCPFCGSDFLISQEPHDNHPVGGKFYIYHDYGALGSPGRKCRINVEGHFDTEAEALAFWNTRRTTATKGDEDLVEAFGNLFGRYHGSTRYPSAQDYEREAFGRAAVVLLRANQSKQPAEPVQSDIDDYGAIADSARMIASYCDGPPRVNVYQRAKQEIVSHVRKALEDAEELVEHFGETEGTLGPARVTRLQIVTRLRSMKEEVK